MKASEDWGELVTDAGGATPIVFHFRPTKFMRVAPERLRDWEQFFAENVGLRPDRELTKRQNTEMRDPYPWTGDPHETISGSNDDWDDCDYM